MWLLAAHKYANESGWSNLSILNFKQIDINPGPPQSCSWSPSDPTQGQLLQMNGTVCVLPPQPADVQGGTVPDVVLVDGPGLAIAFYGYANAGQSYVWTLNNILDDIHGPQIGDGQYNPYGTVIVELNDLDSSGNPLSSVVKFNNAGHEFAHAIGIGHALASPSDIMTATLPTSSQSCISTLNIAALNATYGWLGGPYIQPPNNLSLPVGSYQRDYECA